MFAQAGLDMFSRPLLVTLYLSVCMRIGLSLPARVLFVSQSTRLTSHRAAYTSAAEAVLHLLFELVDRFMALFEDESLAGLGRVVVLSLELF